MSAHREIAEAAASLLSATVIRAAMSPAPGPGAETEAVRRLADLGMTTGITTIRSLIWRCDRWLTKHYRNDHVYRHAVIREFAASGIDVVLPEFKANRSVIDLLAVDEFAHAVEIKSDRDGIGRLRSQLNDYAQIAPLVTIFGSDRVVKSVESASEYQSVGLSLLDSNGRPSQVRLATFEPSQLNAVTMMRSLRRVEYVRTLVELDIELPALPNTRLFSYVREAVSQVDPLTYQDAFVSALRRRRPVVGSSAISRIPMPLRPTILRIDPTPAGLARLRDWLTLEVPYVHA